MRLKDFDYNLPKNLIAQEPANPRDHSRLLVLNKSTGRMEHRYFCDIINYFKKGDVLVLNNTKVMKARLIGRRAGKGGKVEVFLLRKTFLIPPLPEGRKEEVWQCLVGGKKRKENLKVEFARGLKAKIMKDNHDGTSTLLSTGTWQVKFNKTGTEFMKLVAKIGQVPLPPYISSASSEQVRKKQYQTVYADDKKLGSVAAPTAGLHFTPALFKKIKNKGVQIEYVTLHVGLGTFAPVKVDDITKHKMQAEYVEAKASVIQRIKKAKSQGYHIIAVGTTTVRTLETLAKFSNPNNQTLNKSQTKNYKFQTNLFIYPPYKFKIVDAMITNFHLPKSTLLMLVSAFAEATADKSAFVGRDLIFKAYQEAIRKKYRFYSYGDAMLII